jgi:hypothetical protein
MFEVTPFTKLGLKNYAVVGGGGFERNARLQTHTFGSNYLTSIYTTGDWGR